jgi:ABC-type phosphate/phosphonate transport system ATPase subunit
VCTRFATAELVAVTSRRPTERGAFGDVLTGRVIPSEGRVWVNRVPLMRDTRGRIAAMVADAGAELAGHRSALWNVLARPTPGSGLLQRLLRLPRRSERDAALGALASVGLATRSREPVDILSALDRARVTVARALVRPPICIVVREVDGRLDHGGIGALLTLLRGLARTQRFAVVATVADPTSVRGLVDRVVGIADGLLVLDGADASLDEPRQARRLRLVRP